MKNCSTNQLKRKEKDGIDEQAEFCLSENMVPYGCRERFITGGYRRENMSIVDCMKTMFIFKCNETFNIWTHFLPFLLFTFKFFILFTKDYPLKDPFYWPLAANAVGILGFCITSSLAHIFCALSPKARYLCFYMDYAVICVYSGSGWESFYFYTRPLEGEGAGIFENTNVMMLICFKIGVIATFQCCCSRHILNGAQHFLRVSSFVLPWLCAAFPYLYRLRVCQSESECDTSSMQVFFVHTILYIIGAIALASKYPERLFPGKLNVLGHSHQIMHICTALGSNYQFETARMEMVRRETLLRKEMINQNYSTNCLWFTIAMVVVNFSIAFTFPKVSQILFGEKQTEKKKNI